MTFRFLLDLIYSRWWLRHFVSVRHSMQMEDIVGKGNNSKKNDKKGMKPKADKKKGAKKK